jgi:hypothetical protein
MLLKKRATAMAFEADGRTKFFVDYAKGRTEVVKHI